MRRGSFRARAGVKESAGRGRRGGRRRRPPPRSAVAHHRRREGPCRGTRRGVLICSLCSSDDVASKLLCRETLALAPRPLAVIDRWLDFVDIFQTLDASRKPPTSGSMDPRIPPADEPPASLKEPQMNIRFALAVALAAGIVSAPVHAASKPDLVDTAVARMAHSPPSRRPGRPPAWWTPSRGRGPSPSSPPPPSPPFALAAPGHGRGCCSPDPAQSDRRADLPRRPRPGDGRHDLTGPHGGHDRAGPEPRHSRPPTPTASQSAAPRRHNPRRPLADNGVIHVIDTVLLPAVTPMTPGPRVGPGTLRPVLVAGATGYVGGRIVAALECAGVPGARPGPAAERPCATAWPPPPRS